MCYVSGWVHHMVLGKRVVVVLPAYKAAKTLERTLADIDRSVVDDILLVDDCSPDDTVEVAESLGITVVRHTRNRGYGGNQKTCYNEALLRGADIVVMVHPDYQYAPTLVGALASLIASGEYDVVLGSRILGTPGARKSGMPLWKYIANRILTLIENVMLGVKLSEYHTGFRAFSSNVLRACPLEEASDDFVFDNQMLAQIIFFKFRIGEVSVPTRYFDDASSINFSRSVIYGFGVLGTALTYVLQSLRIIRSPLFDIQGKKLPAALEG
jgi:glycosyltransferase involved in cell wall biosynthesis